MSLISCSKCGRVVNHRAEACPSCGNIIHKFAPTNESVSPDDQAPPSEPLVATLSDVQGLQTVQPRQEGQKLATQMLKGSLYDGIRGWLGFYWALVSVGAASACIRTFTYLFVPGSKSNFLDPVGAAILLYIAVTFSKRQWRTIQVARYYHAFASVIALISLLTSANEQTVVALTMTSLVNLLLLLYLLKSMRVQATFG